MKKQMYGIGLLCTAFLCFPSCTNDDLESDGNYDPGSTVTIPEEDEEEYVDYGDEELIPNSQILSLDYQVGITFSADSAHIDNPFADEIRIETHNGHVTITSTLTDIEVNYVLSGITTDGSVKIYGDYRFGLVLNGTGITNPQGAAINIQCGKKVTVTVVDQTQNRLIDGETYAYTEDEDMKGTFFSEGQLNFYGNGTLEIRGKNKHAICTDDYFRMYEGTILIKEAASDAIHAKDYATLLGGSLTTRSQGEGIDSDGAITIEGGTLDITTTGQKGHGLKSGESITIDGNSTNVTIKTEGTASKCINSDGDIQILNGTFNLKTTGNAYFDTDDNDTSSAAGIKCDGNLVIENGSFTIRSTGSGGKGINAGNTLVINGGTLSVTTTGSQYVYSKYYDTAAKAVKSTGNLTINGGTITVLTYQTEAEGIESKAILTITGGEIEITAYDDCINASSHIQVDGGTIYCYSTTNDAIDSNGTFSISGGTIVAAGASSPEAGIDCDQSRFSITGGTLVALGGDNSTPTASASTQPSVIYKSSNSGIQIIRIEETANGTEALTLKLPRTYSQTNLLFSSAALKTSTGYTIYTGGSISGGSNFQGLYSGSTYTKGSSAGTFTTGSASGSVTSTGSSTGGGIHRP